MLLQILLLALAVYWVSSFLGWPFLTTAIVVGVVYGVYYLARHQGWLGLRPAAPSTRGSISGRAIKWLVGLGTLTMVMMLGTAVVGVSNNYAFTSFLALGIRPWLYPHGVPTDLLIWVALFVLATGVAVATAKGKTKPVLLLFGATLVFLFVVREKPRTAEAVRPRAASGPAARRPGETQAKADWDAATGERGEIPTDLCVAMKWAVGTHWPCAKWSLGDFIPSTHSTSAPTTRTVVVSPAPATPAGALVLRHECETPCSVTIGWPFKIAKSGGRTLVVTAPGSAPVIIGSGDADIPEVFGDYTFESPAGEPAVHLRVYEKK